MRYMLFVVALFSAPIPALAETVTVEVTIRSVDVTTRTLTVEHNGKTTELDLSRKAVIFIAGEEAEASSLIPGDKATVEYHRDLEVVTKVDAEGGMQNGWRFFDVFNKGIGVEEAFLVDRDGRLVCLRQAGGTCLASLPKLTEFQLIIDFFVSSQSKKGGPWISVGSTLPNPSGGDYTKQMPFGIEIKLRPDVIGELTLPRSNFKVDLPLGQLRDDRKIVPLRKPDLKTGDWNTLEVTCDQHKNVIVKVNGTTVNAIAKAENTTGHIVIFPQVFEMQFRNAVVLVEGEEMPLSFHTIVSE